MDLIALNSPESSLMIFKSTSDPSYVEISKRDKLLMKSIEELSSVQASSQSSILVVVPGTEVTTDFLNTIFKLGKPGAKLVIKGAPNLNNLELNLKTTGFINVEAKKDGDITACKPNYEIGSATKLNLKKNTIWKLDDDDEEEDTIDPDNLLDDDDLKKPDPASLRVCGTTGKRKACKDCSCGLAEELQTEVQAGKVVDTSNDPKSSCGSCYLGDAFRCASCPYLGMPAFKPGEKIQLSDNLLKADL